MESNQNKEFAPGEEVSSLLEQIAENIGWSPNQEKTESSNSRKE